MSFKSSLKLTAPIFSKTKRRQAFSNVVRRAIKGFRRSLQEKMIAGPHTGKITTRGKSRGGGFSRQHQASRVGERPAPDSNELINSITDEMTGELSGLVRVEAEHGEILQKSGRLVMTDDDRREAEALFIEQARKALIDLL